MEKYKRTPRDFVEDFLTNLRTEDEIMIVAKNSRWINRLDEVKTVLDEFSGKVSENLIRFS